MPTTEMRRGDFVAREKERWLPYSELFYDKHFSFYHHMVYELTKTKHAGILTCQSVDRFKCE